MKIRLKFAGGIATAGLLCAASGFAQEEDEHHTLDEIIVSATPLDRTVEQLVQPTSVVSGDALVRRQSTSIGESLADQPGVTATYFGPVASRPVIRGQFGERVRVLSNGLDSLDASALSEDHAISLDSILADRVEIVRGPATLLYGSGAAGGLVNIVDSRIHEKPLDLPFSGALSIGRASATGKQSGAIKLDIGDELLAAHFDAFSRDTDDVEVSNDVSPSVITNSDSQSGGGAAAVTASGDWGYTGLSLSGYNSNYGIPAEDDVRIDLDQQRVDLKGELGFDAFIDNIHYRIARNDYTHSEFEGVEIGTVFETLGTDARIEFRHRRLGNLEGAVGLQFKDLDFSAIGDEAFVPASETRQLSLFAFEEFAVTETFVLQASARIEHQEITSPLLPAYDDSAFGGSIGAIWTLGESATLSANLSLTERHANSTELYADGPHVAVQRFERGSVTQGNGMLAKERSTNVDATFRSQFAGFELSLTGFVNSIDDYIVLRPTVDVADGLQVFVYEQADIDMAGFEAEILFDLFESDLGHLHARFTSDLVRAEESSGANLPRIPPWRYGIGLHYTHDTFEASVSSTYHDRQTRVAVNESPTAGYTLVEAEASLRFADDALLLYLKGTNLGDEDARRHSSPLKDVVPLPGRSVHAGLRWDF